MLFGNPLVTSIMALAAGILVLIFPAILNYIVGIYLILFGILGLFGHLG